MTWPIVLITVVIAVAFGALVGWFLAREKSGQVITALREEKAALIAQLESERAAGEMSRELLETAENRLKATFEALSAEALRNNTDSFLNLAKASLSEFQQLAKSDLEGRQKAVDKLVQPIEKALDDVRKQMQEIEKDRADAYGGIRQSLQNMSETQAQLQTETANLVKALRQPSVRGRWGEIQLERVVEMAGMVEHCDFVEQESVDGDQGRLRPDLVVHLPGGKSVVVDAKTPLMAYLEALEAEDDHTRERLLQDHARQVREHIKALSSKDYSKQFQPAPDFVVMFLPGESFYSSAVRCDPSLIEFGIDRGVIPASPTTLVTLLRAVHYGWRQERLKENAQAIAELGRQLHKRIRVWAGHLAKVGHRLDGAVDEYNRAVGSLERRVLVSVRRFSDLGISSRKEVPRLEPIDVKPRAIQSVEFEEELESGNGDTDKDQPEAVDVD